MRRKDSQKNEESLLVDPQSAGPEGISAKTVLAIKLNELIEKRELSQIEVASITGMTQPKVSQVRRYKLQNISLERLMQALVALDQRIEIIVRPTHRTHIAGITVVA